VIGQVAVRPETARDLVRDRVEGGIGGARVEELRDLESSRREEPAERPRGDEHPAKCPELERRQDATDPDTLDAVPYVVEVSQWQGRTTVVEA
jgi:hypothetical protein